MEYDTPTGNSAETWLRYVVRSNPSRIPKPSGHVLYDPELTVISSTMRSVLLSMAHLIPGHQIVNTGKKLDVHETFSRGNSVFYIAMFNDGSNEYHSMVHHRTLSSKLDRYRFLHALKNRGCHLVPWDQELGFSDYHGKRGEYSIAASHINYRSKEFYRILSVNECKQHIGIMNTEDSVNESIKVLSKLRKALLP